MLAVNYDNAGMLDDDKKSKYFTARERYYAEVLRQRVKLFDFLHYFFFCASSFSGMVHEYRDFIEFISKEGQYKNVPKDRLFKPAMTRFGHVLIFAAILALVSSFFPKPYLLTEEYSERSLLLKALYLVGACTVKQVTLVLGFTAMECSFIACGQGYRPAKKATGE